jgi:hypothetical protein
MASRQHAYAMLRLQEEGLEGEEEEQEGVFELEERQHDDQHDEEEGD